MIEKIRQAGFTIQLDHGDLTVQPFSKLSNRQLAYLKTHKAEIIQELRQASNDHGAQLADFDDRITCEICQRLLPDGGCMATKRGLMRGAWFYKPSPELKRRCAGYQPKYSDADQRGGYQRWPGLE